MNRMQIRLPILTFFCLFLIWIGRTQAADTGRDGFENRCAKCHGGDGNGGELGPNIVARIPFLDDKELSTLIRSGIPGAGMPAFTVEDAEMRDLVGYLRTLRPRRGLPARCE